MDAKVRQKTLRLLSNGVYERRAGHGRKTSAPVLASLPAHIECQVERIVDTDGDHAMVILRAVEAECREQVTPLTIAETPWEYGG